MYRSTTLVLCLWTFTSANGSIIGGERISIQVQDLNTLKGATWGPSSGPGLVLFDQDSPEANRWFQLAVIPVGTSWRTPTSAKIRLSVRGEEATGHVLQVTARYSVDRVHWSKWIALPPASDFRHGEAPESARFEGTLTVDGFAREAYDDLMSGEWAKTDPDWTNDEDAFCRWLAREQPEFFCEHAPTIGYVQVRFEFLDKKSPTTRPDANEAKKWSRISEVSGMVYWGVGGLHTTPKRGKEPPPDKKWGFDLAAATANADSGKLNWYSGQSEIGIVATRDIKDAAGRVARKIFYSRRPIASADASGCEVHGLQVRMSERYEYDRAGNRTRVERLDRDGAFTHTETFDYDSENVLTGWTTFDRRGIKVSQRVKVDDQFTTLVFDALGKDIWAIEGVPPQGVDLPYGWGLEVDGLRCGIAPNRTKGRFDDIQVLVSVQNMNRELRDVLIGCPEMMLTPELRGSDGKVVPVDQKRVDARYARLKEMNPGLKPGTWPARHRYSRPWETFILKDWYAKLTPGRYTLTIRRQAPGEPVALESNSIEITIE